MNTVTPNQLESMQAYNFIRHPSEFATIEEEITHCHECGCEVQPDNDYCDACYNAIYLH